MIRRGATDGLKILDALFFNTPRMQRLLAEERQRVTLGDLIRELRESQVPGFTSNCRVRPSDFGSWQGAPAKAIRDGVPLSGRDTARGQKRRHHPTRICEIRHQGAFTRKLPAATMPAFRGHQPVQFHLRSIDRGQLEIAGDFTPGCRCRVAGRRVTHLTAAA